MDDQEVVGEEYENIKERAAIAESLYERKDHLEYKLKDLNKKLNLALDHQQQFMIAACKSAANLEFVIDDTANKVLQKLEPKLGGLSNLSDGF